MSLKNKVKSFHHPDLAHIIEIQDQLQGMLGPYGAGAYQVAEFLDGLDHRMRLAACRGLGPGQLRRLYDLVAGFRKVTIDDIVPPSLGHNVQVRHYGKNSLPAFTIFEKRFLRPEKGAQELWGYNFAVLAPITGPGYFVAKNAADRDEVDIDYNVVPPSTPEGWPAVQPNEQGISTLVYAYMIDRLRGVTQHVSIGRAWKKGKEQPAWFILCKE